MSGLWQRERRCVWWGMLTTRYVTYNKTYYDLFLPIWPHSILEALLPNASATASSSLWCIGLASGATPPAPLSLPPPFSSAEGEASLRARYFLTIGFHRMAFSRKVLLRMLSVDPAGRCPGPPPTPPGPSVKVGETPSTKRWGQCTVLTYYHGLGKSSASACLTAERRNLPSLEMPHGGGSSIAQVGAHPGCLVGLHPLVFLLLPHALCLNTYKLPYFETIPRRFLLSSFMPNLSSTQFYTQLLKHPAHFCTSGKERRSRW